MKRILYVAGARSFYTNHPIRKMKGVIKGIIEKGNSVDFIGGGDITFNKNLSAASGGRGISKIRQKNYLNISISEFLDIGHDLLFSFLILRKLLFYKFDIVLERSSRLHITTLILSKIFKKFYILEWKDHIVDYNSSLFVKYAVFIENIKIKHADKIIVESNILKLQLSKKVDVSKIVVAYNAVDVPNISTSLIKNKFIKSKKLKILYAGGYAYYHNMNLLVDIAKILEKSSFLNRMEFLIIGNGPFKNELLLKLEELNLQNIYKFYDSMKFEELEKFYLEANIGILPGSTDIICPIKVMEYMGYGMIPLIPNYLCNKEVVENNYNGILFNSNDPSSFVRKLKLLVDKNTADLSEIAINANNSVNSNFSWIRTWGSVVVN